MGGIINIITIIIIIIIIVIIRLFLAPLFSSIYYLFGDVSWYDYGIVYYVIYYMYYMVYLSLFGYLLLLLVAEGPAPLFSHIYYTTV